MIKGLNNRLANVPTITGLSNVVADTVITEDLVIGGVDIGTAISDLQQITTGITYDSGTDTTEVDNNITATGTVTAPTFDGMSTKVQVYNASNPFFYSPVFAVNTTGGQYLYRSDPSWSVTPLRINPDNGELQTQVLTASGNGRMNKLGLGSYNSNSISMGIFGNPLPLAQTTTGDFNVGIGYCLPNVTQASNCFAMGYNCGLNVKRSSNNCLMGHRAGMTLNFSNTTTAYSNTIVGDTALTNADEIQQCVAVGNESGLSVLNGNVFCTMIGNRSNVSNGLVYATAIGGFATCTTSNTVQLGRNVDNVNCPNTISVASVATVGQLLSANTQIQGEDSLAGIFRNTDGGVQRSVRIIPNALNGEYNRIQQNGDGFIYTHGSTLDTDSLALSIWSATTNGIRISPTALRMGWGGTTSTPTNMLTFDVSGAYFNTVPKCATAPTLGDDLCNKTYVDTSVAPQNVNATSYNLSANHYPLFVAGSGIQQVRMDDTGTQPLVYNPGTNTLGCNTFVGALSGNASSASVATQVTLTNNATTATNYLVMSTTASGSSNLRTDTDGATYDSTTNTANMNITGNAGTLTIQNSSGVSGVYYPTFVTGSGANQSMYIDAVSSTLEYNPVTATMTLQNLTNMGTITGRDSSTIPFIMSAPSGNTGTLTIRHQNTTTAGSILIHTTGASGGNIALRTNGSAGKGLTISNIGDTTFDYSEAYMKVFTGAPQLGILGFSASPVDGTNIVCGYNATRATFTAGGNNTIYGANIGTLMNTTTKNNTIIGFNSGNQLTSGGSNTFVGSNVGALTTTGIENVAIGQGALSSNIAGSDNVCIGFNAGSNITGSSNVCIGSGATVPTAGGSNQVVLGGALDTVFIGGAFRFQTGTQITGTITLPLGSTTLANFYSVNITLAAQTITLPDPTNYDGHMITFKRKANNTQYTLASGGGGTRFIPFNSITPSATFTVTTAIFQQTIICDGNNWCIVSQT